MPEPWQLRVTDSRGVVYEVELTGPAEIGRQQNRDEKQPAHYQAGAVTRVVIAPLEETTMARRHLEVRPLPDGRFLLTNKSTTQMVGLPGKDLNPSEMSDVTLPVLVRLGVKAVRIQMPDQDEEGLECLPMATMAPGSGSLLPSMQATIARAEGPGMQTDQLVGWIQAFLGLLQSAAGSDDFFTKAARVLIDLVKLDSGRVLLYADNDWQAKTLQTGQLLSTVAHPPSRRVLNSVLREKKTFWQVPRQGGASTQGVEAVVAAPILDRHGEVIGALYGERRLDSAALGIGGAGRRPISLLEAMLVEVLASGVAAGLARVEQEQAAVRAHLQMEQFFGQRLATKLEDHPELLVGRDTAVTVLFCDIRGFSRVSEKLGPAKTVEWISDVMSDLSQCVIDHEGVVVDYVGDEVMAMWGAPEDQPDHALRACKAGLAMLDILPRLNERWRPIVQEDLDLGIGINSGIAQVGNVGSRLKFKYGALGNTVNLGSRVQGATKYLKTRLLITDSTRMGLAEQNDPFAVRRLCQVRVVNIAQPVTLFELIKTPTENWTRLKQGYEQALEEFNKAAFRPACGIIGQLIAGHPDDGPSLVLLARAVACLVEEPEAFDPVMVLPGK